MNELAGKLWAVISERGCEASSLAYMEAAQLVSRLRIEKISGLCVVTAAAAQRLKQPQSGNGQSPSALSPSQTKAREP